MAIAQFAGVVSALWTSTIIETAFRVGNLAGEASCFIWIFFAPSCIKFPLTNVVELAPSLPARRAGKVISCEGTSFGISSKGGKTTTPSSSGDIGGFTSIQCPKSSVLMRIIPVHPCWRRGRIPGLIHLRFGKCLQSGPWRRFLCLFRL